MFIPVSYVICPKMLFDVLFVSVKHAGSLFSIPVLPWNTEPGTLGNREVCGRAFNSSLFKSREFPLITGVSQIKEDH